MTTRWGTAARISWLAVLVPVQASVMVGLGLALTSGGAGGRLESAEERVVREAVAYRDGWVDVVSQWLSTLARTETVVGVTVVSVALLVLSSGGRRRREAGFLGAAVALQAAVFLVVTAFVERPRPGVPHLDAAPPTSGFPSGHVGAAVALYGGWLVLVFARSARGPWRYASLLLLLVPAAVGVSRIHRGMHYPTDVLGGLLNGTLTLLLVGWALLASRSPGGEPPARPRSPSAPGRWGDDGCRGTHVPRADADVPLPPSPAARQGGR
ncbi:phosphatase PAP2 family protein [Streptomyces sp. NPDC013457]|uniref:phosphatase PAP2 family protein n=1 Tax=Streptomyces sp. NPDC013457 TaxID=3364866 RepID=UPI0036FC1545